MLDGIIASDDTLYKATNKKTYLEHTIRRYCYLIARSHLLALCCRRCTIGGINELSRSILRNGNKLYFERIIAYAGSFVNESCFQALVKEVSIMIATQHLLPISSRVFHLIHTTNSSIESLVYCHSIVCRCCDLYLIVAHIGDASSLTSRNHSTNLVFIFLPMGKEHTWCARHSKKISVGSECVATNRILLFTCRAIFHIVVLYEGNSILAPVLIIHKIISTLQSCPVVAINSIANIIAELEVESGTIL